MVFAILGSTALASQISFTARVFLAKKREVQIIQTWISKVKRGDRSLCIGYRGTDMSGCVWRLARDTRIRSNEGLKAMLELVVAAAVKDRSLGFGDPHVSVALANNFLTVGEVVRPQVFFVRSLRSATARDRVDQRLAIQNEDAGLESFRRQALPSIETHLSRTERLSSTSDPELPRLRERLTKLKARQWRLS